MGYKLIPLTFLLLLLTYPIGAQETGTLYLKKVNGKIGWFESGNTQKHWEYTGEIFEGKPNGKGTLISPFENYSGEFKNGKMHGQISHIFEWLFQHQVLILLLLEILEAFPKQLLHQ